ncbi:MAG: MFS transporter [Magnetococcales bacterium]|nr:MFS transporter [Magnetococcales bacterium]
MSTQVSQNRALFMSTLAFTVSFAVWTIFSIIGVQIKEDLMLTETQFSILVGLPILTGSLVRLILGIWADQFGARFIFVSTMFVSAAFTWLLTIASSYEVMLLAALGLGVAGGTFVVGISYLAKIFPSNKQGTALGVFGMGNVGAAVTKFVAPMVMVAYGWHTVAQVWAVALVVSAVLFLMFTENEKESLKNEKRLSFMESIEPLKKLQVWRFSLYYFFVFGGFVALALWLPHYYVDVYNVDIKVAGMLAASFSLSASLFRAAGGYLSDKYGARSVMYWAFGVSVVCCFLLSYPSTVYTIQGVKSDIEFSLSMGVIPFTVLLFILGFVMSLGKAAIYKHIPIYYPNHVGSVAGIVGLVGGLGGFVLPIMFGLMNDYLNVWTSCFMLLFVLVSIALIWMTVAIRRMEKEKYPVLKEPQDFPEMANMNKLEG